MYTLPVSENVTSNVFSFLFLLLFHISFKAGSEIGLFSHREQWSNLISFLCLWFLVVSLSFFCHNLQCFGAVKESQCFSETWDLLLLKYLFSGKIQGALPGCQKGMVVTKQRAGYPWLVMRDDLDILWSTALLLHLGVSLKSFLETALWKREEEQKPYAPKICVKKDETF